MRGHDCSWDKESGCVNAAMGGHLEVLQWARERHCPWNARTRCEGAAWGGHLEVLQWAVEHDCPLDPDACVDAAGTHGTRARAGGAVGEGSTRALTHTHPPAGSKVGRTQSNEFLQDLARIDCTILSSL